MENENFPVKVKLEEFDSDYEMSEEEFELCYNEDIKNIKYESEEPIEYLRTWKSGPHIPVVYEFHDSQSGVKGSNLCETSPESIFFEHFLNDSILSKIVRQTNRFFNYYYDPGELGSKSRSHSWIDTTVPELYTFFAVTMLMTRNKHLNVDEHWSSDPFLHSPIFRKTMSRDRYELILQMLHFSDPIITTASDKLYKIRILLDHTRKIFKDTLIPFENLRIDESLGMFKGRLVFKQYIPSKMHRFGIKMFILCDVMTGYIIDFIIFCGEGTNVEDEQNLGIPGAVVTTVLKDYIGKGHSLWCDSYFTSPALFQYLHSQKTNACGMVKENLKDMPDFKALDRGELESKSKGPLLALKWCNSRDVYMLTTLHDDSLSVTGNVNSNTGKAILKPNCIFEYNKNTGAVDKADLMISNLACMSKSLKWYKKVAFHMIDLYLLNAFYLHKFVTKSKKSLADFQLSVIKQLIEKYCIQRGEITPHMPTNIGNPFRLLPKTAVEHMPEYVPPTKNVDKPRRRCRVCFNSKVNKKKCKLSRFLCRSCDVALCLQPCFKIYHSASSF